MSFPDLHEHIQQTFAAFMGSDDYDAQLTLWCWQRRHEQREADRDWKARNRQREAERLHEHYLANRERILQRNRADAAAKVAATKAWRARNREALRVKERERWHDRKRRDAARKAA